MSKIELNWQGKDDEIFIKDKVLVEDKNLSYENSPQYDDGWVNKIIFGDNLEALKALEKEYIGKVKCIYIDPPYNTGKKFKHYDDNKSHSDWLSFIKERLILLQNLLSDNGSIWISIDDDECHYLKVLCDEVFGRSNFINNIVWQKKVSPQNDAKYFSDNHDHILVYTKNKKLWKPNLLPRTEEANKRYKNPDNDPRGAWLSMPCHVNRFTPLTSNYGVTTPSGKVVFPPKGTSWRFSKKTFVELMGMNKIWFGTRGENIPRCKRFLSEVKQGMTSMTIWTTDMVGSNIEANKESKNLNNGLSFITPKPERLLQRIIHLSTNKGDIVLDCFAGSGTTGAVAHKMGRKWIMIELCDQCKTHIVPRMQKVINGEDQGGITKKVEWQGGGGFKFYNLKS